LLIGIPVRPGPLNWAPGRRVCGRLTGQGGGKAMSMAEDWPGTEPAGLAGDDLAAVLAPASDGALQQMLRKIETAAGFTIIDRSSTPLSPTDAGRDFIHEAHQILRAAWEQTAARPYPEGGCEKAGVPFVRAEVMSASGVTPRTV
jgi:hypothetical protein